MTVQLIFAGQNTTYSCDTEVNLCYSNPCLNLGTCVQIEGGFRCICPTGYKGIYSSST